MNKVVLMGRLTRDPDVRYTTTNNTLVASFSLAVNRRFARQGEERQADFINVVAWDKTGEFCSKYFKKGQQVGIIGRIQTRNYDDKDGKKVYVTEVVALSVQFLSSGSNNGSTSSSYSEPNPFDNIPEPSVPTQQPVQSVSVEKDPFESFGESVTISDNDLPF